MTIKCHALIHSNWNCVSTYSISKESIIDIYVRPVTVAAKIEFCTEQNLELVILEIFLVSAAKPQLPLQIEDASRPEHNDVNIRVWQLLVKSSKNITFTGCWSIANSS